MNNPNMKNNASVMSDEEFERFYAEIYREFGPAKPQENTDLLKDMPVRRVPGPYDEAPKVRKTVNTAPKPPRKKENIRGVLTVICLEVLGIAGVAMWWALRLL